MAIIFDNTALTSGGSIILPSNVELYTKIPENTSGIMDRFSIKMGKAYGSSTGTLVAYLYEVTRSGSTSTKVGVPKATSAPLSVAGMSTTESLQVFNFSPTSLDSAKLYDIVIISTAGSGDLASVPLSNTAGVTQTYYTIYGNQFSSGVALSKLENINTPVLGLSQITNTWSTSGSMLAAATPASCGTQNAAFSMTGYAVSSGQTDLTTKTEKFDGSVWSAGADVISGAKSGAAACGSLSAALLTGGTDAAFQSTATTSNFNGTAWSTKSDMPITRGSHALVGANNAALVFGGNGTGATSSKNSYTFNGVTWSTNAGNMAMVGSTSSARILLAGAGTTGAAVAFGGMDSNSSAVTEKFNGSTWSAAGSLGTARRAHSGGGSQTAAIAVGGIPYMSSSESYNGTDWSAGSSISTARGSHGGAGSQGSALVFGGQVTGGTRTASTEKLTQTGGVSPFFIAEGVLANATVAALSAAEAGMVFTKVAGSGDTDNASFNISGSSLITLADIDYETKSSYSVRIQASNGTTTYQNVVTINVSNVNEAPSNISLSAASIQENNAVNAVIGTLSGVDVDGDALTFSIVSGGDKFNLNGNNLRASVAFNYEEATSHSVTIRATDAGGLYKDQSFTINVSNVNEAPSNISLSAASIQEGNAVNAVIGTLSGVDVDGNALTFSISGGADAAKFNINGAELRASQAFDYEAPADANADNVYVVQITAQDAGGLSYTKSFNISVSNNASDDTMEVSSTVSVNGRVKITVAIDPRTIPILLGGAPVPTGSVVRNSVDSKKFIKKAGTNVEYSAILSTVPAAWKWASEGETFWAMLQDI